MNDKNQQQWSDPDGKDGFRERVALKQESTRRRFTRALERLAGVMKGTHTPDVPEYDADHLFSACVQVGKACGITVCKPPEESIESHDDPLTAMSRYSGFRLRKVTFMKDQRWWEADNGPLLAFRTGSRSPVALLPQGPKRYMLVDPQSNERTVVSRSVVDGIEPDAWMFYRPFPDRPVSGKDLFRFGIRGSSGDMGYLVMFGFGAALLGLLTPVLTGVLFGTVIPEASRPQLLQVTFILVASVLSVSGFRLAQQVSAMRLQNRIDMLLQPALLDRLLKLPSSFFRSFSSGDLVSRVMGATQIREICSSSATGAFLGMIFGTMNLLLLFYYSWQLGLLAIVLSVVFIGVSSWLTFRQVTLTREALQTEGKISGLLGNLLTGIMKIRVTGTEKSAFSLWAEKYSKERGRTYEAGIFQNMLTVTVKTFPVVALALIIVSAGGLLTGVELKTGDFIAFSVAYTAFQTALMESVTTLIGCVAVIPLYERLKPILAAVPESGGEQTCPGKLTGRLELKNVNFSYSEDGPQILHDISIKAAPGEFIALVGSSGSGKSTLFRLLLGFEKPDTGTVYYDRVDLSTLNVQDVRRQTGVVMQNGHLQPGMVLDCIVGSSNLTVEDAWEAARLAGIAEDIERMPMGMGMYTLISEGSHTISGGQKQRLLIAGALVRKPRIILFDEATSFLDNKTQEIVSQSLERMNATRVVIAHRLSTIRHADRIYCLDRGRIVEAGSFEELMARDGFFRQFARRQIA